MSDIPPEMYERIHELVINLVNASNADDDVLRQTHYIALKAFCDEQVQLGNPCAFLWETLADFTEDEEEQLKYYQKAFLLAKEAGEPLHSILLGIGRVHFEMENFERAIPCLMEARREAIESDDLDDEGEAVALLLEIENQEKTDEAEEPPGL